MTRPEAPDDDDPVLDQFLDFLVADIARHPERMQAVGTSRVQRLQLLVDELDVDLDTALPEDDE